MNKTLKNKIGFFYDEIHTSDYTEVIDTDDGVALIGTYTFPANCFAVATFDANNKTNGDATIGMIFSDIREVAMFLPRDAYGTVSLPCCFTSERTVSIYAKSSKAGNIKYSTVKITGIKINS